MNNIYERNFPSINEEEQEKLKNSKVAVIGCGGLGGYIAEMLARLGAGNLTLVDGDVFETSNFNRQILATDSSLGKNKAIVARKRILSINPNINVTAFSEFFDSDNADKILPGNNLVMDALDNVSARLILEDKCAISGITIVHGAIQGFSAQITVAPPGENVLHSLYKNTGGEFSKTSLSFTPPLCASLQVAEGLKLLLGKESTLTGKLLVCDLTDSDFEILELL